MQRKINLTQVFCLQIRKNTKAKPYQVILRSSLPRNHYYQSQAVTSIMNLTKPFGLSRNTNLQSNSYPNTQLDLYCSEQSFRSMHESQYVTNQWCMDPNMWLTPAIWRGCWLQNSSVHQQWRSRTSLIIKPLA